MLGNVFPRNKRFTGQASLYKSHIWILIALISQAACGVITDLEIHYSKNTTSRSDCQQTSSFAIFKDSQTAIEPNEQTYQTISIDEQKSWHWQLTRDLSDDYADLTIIDLFISSDETIEQIHKAKTYAICYFSVGSSANWLPDYASFKPENLGNTYPGQENEYWLNIAAQNVSESMLARLLLAKSRQCHGVALAKLDSYEQDTCFNIDEKLQRDYIRWLANQAHALGLLVALVSPGSLSSQWANYIDFVIVEDCYHLGQCDDYQIFLEFGKPIFNAEYSPNYREMPDKRNAICLYAQNNNIQIIGLSKALDQEAWFVCP